MIDKGVVGVPLPVHSSQLRPNADKLFDALFSAKDCFPFPVVALGAAKETAAPRSPGEIVLKRV